MDIDIDTTNNYLDDAAAYTFDITPAHTRTAGTNSNTNPTVPADLDRFPLSSYFAAATTMTTSASANATNSEDADADADADDVYESICGHPRDCDFHYDCDSTDSDTGSDTGSDADAGSDADSDASSSSSASVEDDIALFMSDRSLY